MVRGCREAEKTAWRNHSLSKSKERKFNSAEIRQFTISWIFGAKDLSRSTVSALDFKMSICFFSISTVCYFPCQTSSVSSSSFGKSNVFCNH